MLSFGENTCIQSIIYMPNASTQFFHVSIETRLLANQRFFLQNVILLICIVIIYIQSIYII